MTTLLIKRLLTGETLSQEFTLKNETRYHVEAIIPYLYVHNVPSGTFHLKVKQGSTVVYSHDFNKSDIQASLGTVLNYFFVYYPVIPEPKLKLGSGSFTLELSATGYTYDMNSFIGWIREHESLVNKLDYVPANDLEKPYSFKLKTLKEAHL